MENKLSINQKLVTNQKFVKKTRNIEVISSESEYLHFGTKACTSNISTIKWIL